MEPTKLLEQLFDKKKVAVLRQFLAQPEREWTLVELAKSSRVPNATTYRIINHLVKLELIEERKIKHLKQYVLAKSPASKYLTSILETGGSALESFIEQVESIAGISQVILHGTQTKDKANVLVIGTGIRSAQINEITQHIQEEFKFTIITLVLDPSQYEQMASMGLYSGVKKVLYPLP